MTPCNRLLLAGLALVCLFSNNVTAKAVFAHFMVSNADGWSQAQWQTEIDLAKQAKIDAFALNIAHGDAPNSAQLVNAFGAANSGGFKLFFSFDYAGGDGSQTGGWLQDEVRALLRQYANNGAYYKRGSQPLVSTFEGPGHAGDWASIKSEFGIFFIPDWSSLGAKKALEAAPSGVLDGLFSWAAWPWGTRKMDTYTDASYLNYLGGPDTGKAKYMMAMSPWFYTNMPGFTKNWMWNGIDLWHDRWQQVLTVQPEFVEIISWNDFGESHYIGPVRDSPPFKEGKAIFDYVSGQTHDGWRVTLPYYIDLYKTGTTTIAQESVVAWYTLHSLPLCGHGDTTLNTATQEQYEFEPQNGRTIYFSAVLASVANVTISVGGVERGTIWTHEPYGGVGVYHGSAQAGDVSGDVHVILKRGNDVLATIIGKPVGGCGPNGLANFNPYVGSAVSTKSIAPKSPPLNVADMVCVEGTGIGDFQDICEFNCKYTNCPVTACVCTRLGPKPTIPPWKNTPGYTRGDPNFIGLCNYACNLGYCPSDVCSTTPMPIVDPPVSPFYPDTCIEGTSRDANSPLKSLCEFTCKYGYCPIRRCKCTAMGTLRPFPAEDDSIVGLADFALRSDAVAGQMCGFSCRFGGCISGACVRGSLRTVTSGPKCEDATNKDDWKCLTCRDHGQDYLSPSRWPAQSWDLSKTADSLAEFQKWYDDSYDHLEQSQGYYTRAIAVFYNLGGGDFACGTADSPGCTSRPECNDDRDSFTVAGAVVMGSLVGMNNFFTQWQQELHNAALNISFWSQKFADTFAKSVDDKTLGDVFGKWLVENVMGSLLGGVWKVFGLKTDDKFEDAAGYFEQLSDFVTGKITDAVDKSMEKDPDFTKDDIEQALSEILTLQLEGVNSFTVSMFNASKDSIEDRKTFENAIRGGAWLKTIGLTNLDLEKKAATYIFNQLIPEFWQKRPNMAPVIIKSDDPNDNSNPFAQNVDNAPGYQPKLLSDEQAEAARLHADGHTFWLAATKRCDSWSYNRDFGWVCDEPEDNQYFILPPGFEELGPDSAWGVYKDDMILSAWAGYKRNGNKNGYDPAKDPEGRRSNSPDAAFLFGDGPRMPGLNKIPVCNYTLAYHNTHWWYNLNHKTAPKPCDEYPCCEDLDFGNPP